MSGRKLNSQALARCLTRLEANPVEAQNILPKTASQRTTCFRIGITGPGGCGKSTLINKMIGAYRKQKKTVGVLAVDPSSIRTGGAFLGDRIRMQEHARDPGVFIRSMAHRGQPGGIAPALADAMRAMELHGFHVILVESIGAGQADTALKDLCDVLVVLSPPEAVDIVQSLKSGLMEAADVLVISKADLPGAQEAEKTLLRALSLREASGDSVPVVAVSAAKNTGIEKLVGVIARGAKQVATKHFASEQSIPIDASIPFANAKSRLSSKRPVATQIHALDHVAIAVRRIQDHLPLYVEKLGLRLEGTYIFKSYGVRIASLLLNNARIELLEPLGKTSAIGNFLAKRGNGLHHMAFKVTDLRERVADLKKKGFAWINEKPRPGLHNTRVCFLHPSNTKGILLEFVE